MITVHHLNQSRSQRILWMLEELEVPYQLKSYRREPTMLAPDALKQVHPLGKAPVITDGNLTLAESGAILEYLAEQYDTEQRFTLNDPAERIAARYWLHYAEGSLMPLLVMKLIFSRLGKAPVPLVVRPFGALINLGFRRHYLDGQLALHQQTIEHHLAQRPWFAGNNFSVADVQMSFPLQALMARCDSSPHIQAWLDRVASRAAWQRAVQRGGDIDLPE